MGKRVQNIRAIEAARAARPPAPEPLNVSMSVMTITPRIAAQWLAANTNNRPVRARYVKQLADTIVRGEWQLNGDPIRFSETGALLDGQHRLMAVVQADQPIRSYVARGLKDDCMPTIDINRARTARDLFHWAGHSYSAQLAAAVRLLFSWDQGWLNARQRGGQNAVTHRQLLDAQANYPGIEDDIGYLHGLFAKAGMLPSSIAIALHYRFKQVAGKTEADAFMERLAKGDMLARTSPIYRLREWIRNARGRKRSVTQSEYVALTIKAWNSRHGELKILVWRDDEALPSIKSGLEGA